MNEVSNSIWYSSIESLQLVKCSIIWGSPKDCLKWIGSSKLQFVHFFKHSNYTLSDQNKIRENWITTCDIRKFSKDNSKCLQYANATRYQILTMLPKLFSRSMVMGYLLASILIPNVCSVAYIPYIHVLPHVTEAHNGSQNGNFELYGYHDNR